MCLRLKLWGTRPGLCCLGIPCQTSNTFNVWVDVLQKALQTQMYLQPFIERHDGQSDSVPKPTPTLPSLTETYLNILKSPNQKRPLSTVMQKRSPAFPAVFLGIRFSQRAGITILNFLRKWAHNNAAIAWLQAVFLTLCSGRMCGRASGPAAAVSLQSCHSHPAARGTWRRGWCPGDLWRTTSAFCNK